MIDRKNSVRWCWERADLTSLPQTTPSHGGMITGHEFDLTVHPPSSREPEQPKQPQDDETPPIVTVSDHRRLQPSTASRPRPVSMPPQSIPPVVDANGTRNAATTTGEQRTADASSSRNGTTGRSSRGTRILGDYTLGKTLGAGSMGKVKLAQHNVTGEKVRRLEIPQILLWTVFAEGIMLHGPRSSQSRSYPGPTLLN